MNDLKDRIEILENENLKLKKIVNELINLLSNEMKFSLKIKNELDYINNDLEKELLKDIAAKKCKICFNSMIIRKGKFGTFKSCSNYPKCKYTEGEK